MTGVTRVVVKRGRQVYFVVSAPEVMKSATNDNTYVFFGEAKQEDSSAALQQAAALQFAQQQAAKQAEAPKAEAAAASTGTVDESGVNSKHIELVLEQVPSASRAQVRPAPPAPMAP